MGEQIETWESFTFRSFHRSRGRMGIQCINRLPFGYSQQLGQPPGQYVDDISFLITKQLLSLCLNERAGIKISPEENRKSSLYHLQIPIFNRGFQRFRHGVKNPHNEFENK